MAEKSELFESLVKPIDSMTEKTFDAVAHFRERDAAVLGVLEALRDFALAEATPSAVRIKAGTAGASDYMAANVAGWLVNRADEFAKESGWV